MKKNLTSVSLFAAAILLLTSCQAIGGIFKAGMGVGIVVVILVVILVLWLIGKTRK